jgi:hypothetical protein
MAGEACTARVAVGYQSMSCRRPVKEDGLCGIHLAAKRRRETNRAKKQDERAVSETTKREVEATLAALGIEGRPVLDSRTFRYTPGVAVVSLDDLRRLAARGEATP